MSDNSEQTLLYAMATSAAAEADSAGAARAIVAALGSALGAATVSFTRIGSSPETIVWSAAADQTDVPMVRFEVTGAHGRVGVLDVAQTGSAPTGSTSIANNDDGMVRGAIALLALAHARDARITELERELTERVRQVAEQRAFIERVVDSLPFGLYVVDREYRIHAWNHKRETGLQGVARTDAIGRTIFEVLHRQPAAMLKKEFDDVFATGRLQQFQMESNAFGDTRTFRISKIPMRVGNEGVTHVITVGEDITDWKAAIDRTAQSEKLAALGQLAAGVMHEINNPLATIAACGESIALHRELQAELPVGATVPGADPGEMLRIIDLEVQRCKKIVNGLLDFARPKPAQRETVDLNGVVQHGMFLLQHHPRYKRVKMVTELEDSRPLLIQGDADQLVQVLIALAMNAIDATPEGGRIVIRTRGILDETGTPQVALEVSDDGPGIPRALQAKVFEPFFTTKPPGQGTGLGLAICYGIVNDHNGQLELVSSEGQGATFRVALPEVALATEMAS